MIFHPKGLSRRTQEHYQASNVMASKKNPMQNDRQIAVDIHKFDAIQNTVRVALICGVVCFVTWQLTQATTAIITANKSFWELFFGWLPACGVMYLGLYRFKRRFEKALRAFAPQRAIEEKERDPNRESSKLLADGTHPNDD